MLAVAGLRREFCGGVNEVKVEVPSDGVVFRNFGLWARSLEVSAV